MRSAGRTLAILAISTLMLGSVSTAALFVGSDAAYAKNGGGGGNGGGNGGDNGGGNGNAGGNGGGHGQGHGQGVGKDRGAGKSAANAGRGQFGQNGKSFKATIGEIFGINKSKANKAASAKSTQNAKAAPASKGPKTIAGMRANQLGSMNAAFNANINAVMAHIANGNTNGPVGAVAALAIADHNAIGAADVAGLAEMFADLENALTQAGYTDVESYFGALNGIEPIAEIEAAREDETALTDALAENGFASLADYDAVVAGAETDPDVDNAIAVLGGDTASRTDVTASEPSEAEIAEAEAALEAVTDAETGIMDSWNKSEDATEAQKADLLGALRDRLSDSSEAISAAVEDAKTTEETTGVITEPEEDSAT